MSIEKFRLEVMKRIDTDYSKRDDLSIKEKLYLVLFDMCDYIEHIMNKNKGNK